MIKLLLLLNGVFLTWTIYTISISWSVFELVPILLFGISMVLLATQRSRLGNQLLVLVNGSFAAVGILIVLVGTIGGLFNYGPGALAVLILLLPIAVLAANAVQAKRMLASAN